MTNICEIKLNRVLSNLLRPDYRITDDTMLEKLLTHLGNDTGEGPQLLALPICETWAKNVLLRRREGKLNATLVSFALRLLGLIMQDENRFKTFIFDEANVSLIERLALMIGPCGDGTKNFSIKCAYLKMLKGFAQHPSGQQWILQTSIWQMVLLCRSDKSMFVVRESRAVMANLLNSMLSDNDSQKEEILSVVLSPLMLIPVPQGNADPAFKARIIIDKPNLVSTLQVLCEILAGALGTVEPEIPVVKSSVARPLNLPRFGLEERFLRLVEIFDEDVLLEYLSKTLILFYITTFASNIIKRKWPDDVTQRFRNLCDDILHIQEILVKKSCMRVVMVTCEVCLTYWPKVTSFVLGSNSKIVEGISPGTKGSFEIQQLGLHMIPLLVGVISPSCEAHDLFITKVCNIVCERLIRLIYAYREIIVKQRMCESLLLGCVSGLMSIKSSLVKENAVIIFQAFIWVLKNYVGGEEHNDLEGQFPAYPDVNCGWGGQIAIEPTAPLISAILDCISSMMSMFRITWRDSVESVCLLSLPIRILKTNRDYSSVAVKVGALKLTKLCIENYMPADLALLSNSCRGSTTDSVGPLIIRLMNDPSWEVRDSALELVLSIATMANIKYPAFQDLIEDNQLCDMLVDCALNDAECYVCATGIKCLSALVLVDRFWVEKLENRRLAELMINFINGDGGDVVRTEATNLILQIYEHRKIDPDLLNDIFALMTKVIMSDYHWEVKVNAIRFWKTVIDKHLSDQGMMDGCFPEITFSKQHRKIIKLTPEIIQERLTGTLESLSKIGCLQVLFEALVEENDLHVMSEAAKVLNFLSDILRNHGLIAPKNQTSSESKDKTDELQQYREALPQKSPNSPLLLGGDNSFQNSPFVCDDTELSSLLDFAANNLGIHDIHSAEQFDDQSMSQDEIIDEILKDKDISLLANVYRGYGAAPPVNEIDQNMKRLMQNPMKARDFMEKLRQINVDAYVEGHKRWIEEASNNLESLLNDMLINIHDDEDYNIADCY